MPNGHCLLSVFGTSDLGITILNVGIRLCVLNNYGAEMFEIHTKRERDEQNNER